MLTPLGSLAGGAAGVVPAGKVVGPGLMHVTLADSTHWCRRTPQAFTRAKVRNTQRS